MSIVRVFFPWNRTGHHIFVVHQLLRVKPFTLRIWVFDLQDIQFRALDLLLLIAEHSSLAILLAHRLPRRLTHKDLAHAKRKHKVVAAFPFCYGFVAHLALAPHTRTASNGYGAAAPDCAIDFNSESAPDGAGLERVGFDAGDDFEAGDDVDWLAVAGELEEVADVVGLDARLEIGRCWNELCGLNSLEEECLLVTDIVNEIWLVSTRIALRDTKRATRA